MQEDHEDSQCYFNPEAITQLQKGLLSVEKKYQILLIKFTNLKLNNEAAREYAHNGFARRIGTLKRCIQNIYALCPPDRPKSFKPTRDECLDLGINLQSFVLNIFGCLDNLAWIWVKEKKLKNKRGELLSGQAVGLMSKEKNKIVWESFSQDFQTYLNSFLEKGSVEQESWYGNLKKFRHALAHRIPLYVPPYSVSPKDIEKHNELEQEKLTSLLNEDVEKYDKLSKEQDDLTFFIPYMYHSLNEKSPGVIFHAQILADWNTVVEISEKFLVEITKMEQAEKRL